jgi:hypothetical protein
MEATMGTKFNWAELNVLNNLKSYRYLSIAFMLVFSVGIALALYFLVVPEATYESRHLNLVRLNGMIIMLGLSFLLFVCIRAIEKIEMTTIGKSKGSTDET